MRKVTGGPAAACTGHATPIRRVTIAPGATSSTAVTIATHAVSIIVGLPPASYAASAPALTPPRPASTRALPLRGYCAPTPRGAAAGGVAAMTRQANRQANHGRDGTEQERAGQVTDHDCAIHAITQLPQTFGRCQVEHRGQSGEIVGAAMRCTSSRPAIIAMP